MRFMGDASMTGSREFILGNYIVELVIIFPYLRSILIDLQYAAYSPYSNEIRS